MPAVKGFGVVLAMALLSPSGFAVAQTAENETGTQTEAAAEQTTAATIEVVPLESEEAPSEQALDEDAQRLDSIVVTAQKREQAIYDVPIAITGLSEDRMQKQGMKSLRDIAAVTPSFSVVETGPGIQKLQIRGISSAILGAATVGYVLDNVSLTGFSDFTPDANTFDLASVEILRGPQGTLYGEGSMGGTVKLNTRQPKIGEWDFRARAEHFLTDGADGGTELSAAVNVPLGESLAMRVVGDAAKIGGFINEVRLGEDNYNSAEKKNGRARWSWLASDALTVNGLLLGQAIDARTSNAADENYERRDEKDLGIEDRSTIVATDATWNASFADVFGTLSSFQRHNIFTYDAREAVTEQVRLGTVGAPISPGLGGATPLDPLTVGAADQFIGGSPGTNEVDSDSQLAEVRLSSNDGESLFWIAGVYAQRKNVLAIVDTTVALDLQGLPAPGGSPPVQVAYLTLDSRSQATAIFGQLEYDWNDWFNTALGARYFQEKVRAENHGTILNERVDSIDNLNFSAFTPRAVGSFRLPPEWFANVDNWLAYVSYAQGFRSGGANIRSRPQVPPTFEPDTLITYELGSKLEMYQGYFTAELALFFNDWRDVQVEVFPPNQGAIRIAAIQNAGNTQGLGVEWNFVINPRPRTSFYLTGSYIDTKYVKGSEIKMKGDFVDFVPAFGGAAGASYGFNWRDGVPGYARVDYNYTGVSNYRVADGRLLSSDAVHFLSARIGLETQKFKLNLYGKNLLDFEGALDANLPEKQARARPPSYGVEVEFNY